MLSGGRAPKKDSFMRSEVFLFSLKKNKKKGFFHFFIFLSFYVLFPIFFFLISSLKNEDDAEYQVHVAPSSICYAQSHHKLRVVIQRHPLGI
jgi:ABC-type glycerol-3-phosphate transport system permease component